MEEHVSLQTVALDLKALDLIERDPPRTPHTAQAEEPFRTIEENRLVVSRLPNQKAKHKGNHKEQADGDEIGKDLGGPSRIEIYEDPKDRPYQKENAHGVPKSPAQVDLLAGLDG
jgi:hypothetical protein